ncbi:MAG: hypothetical protein JOY96_06250 [Verrucomicrobia bacterium]|nr:hypothetical protein [Verrucomicrobiota bacterium]
MIKSGQTVRFPVASNDPLGRFQQLKTVAELTNVHDLAVARKLTTTNPNLTATELSAAVNSFLTSSGASHATTIDLPVDFTVESGATIVFAGPITVVNAQNFYVDGTVAAQGSLNIKCLAFGAPSGNSQGGGVGGGGSVFPEPPPRTVPIKFQ